MLYVTSQNKICSWSQSASHCLVCFHPARHLLLFMHLQVVSIDYCCGIYASLHLWHILQFECMLHSSSSLLL